MVRALAGDSTMTNDFPPAFLAWSRSPPAALVLCLAMRPARESGHLTANQVRQKNGRQKNKNVRIRRPQDVHTLSLRISLTRFLPGHSDAISLLALPLRRLRLECAVVKVNLVWFTH